MVELFNVPVPLLKGGASTRVLCVLGAVFRLRVFNIILPLFFTGDTHPLGTLKLMVVGGISMALEGA